MHLCAARSASLIQRSIDHQTSLPTPRILLPIRAVSSMNTFSSHSREDRPYAAADPPAQRRPARRPARATQSA